MAIHITAGTGDDGLPTTIVTLSNGDREAFNSAMRRWRFLDGIGMLRFIFAIMSKSINNKVWIIDETGKQVAFEPVASLLQTDGATTNGDTADDEFTEPQQPTA